MTHLITCIVLSREREQDRSIPGIKQQTENVVCLYIEYLEIFAHHRIRLTYRQNVRSFFEFYINDELMSY